MSLLFPMFMSIKLNWEYKHKSNVYFFHGKIPQYKLVYMGVFFRCLLLYMTSWTIQNDWSGYY